MRLKSATKLKWLLWTSPVLMVVLLFFLLLFPGGPLLVRHYSGYVNLGGVRAVATIDYTPLDHTVVKAVARAPSGRILRSVDAQILSDEDDRLDGDITLCTSVQDRLECVNYSGAQETGCFIRSNPPLGRGDAFPLDCWEIPNLNLGIVGAIVTAIKNPEHLVKKEVQTK